MVSDDVLKVTRLSLFLSSIFIHDWGSIVTKSWRWLVCFGSANHGGENGGHSIECGRFG